MTVVHRLQHTSIPMPPGLHDAARAFYNGALGLRELTPPATLDPREILWFAAGPDGAEVHLFTEERFGPNSPRQHLCLEVDDLDAFRARLAEQRIAVEEATPIHNRPRYFTHDPFGNRIELTQILGQYQ